jgi:cytochrome P450
VQSPEQAFEAWGSYDQDDPYPLFAEVRELGALHKVTLVDGHDAWLVARHDEAKALLNDPRLSKDLQAALASSEGIVAEGLPGPDFARHMLVVDPPDHTRLRRLVSAAFSVRRIEGLRPRVQSIIDDLLDGIAAQGPDARVDLVASFAFPLPFTVICELLGVPEPDRAPFGRALGALSMPTSTPAEYERVKVGSDAVVRLLTELVETKQADAGDDLVSGLINARDGDDCLDQRELLSTILQLIIAGHDTTTSLIGNGVVDLLDHPDQLRLLQADLSQVPDAVEELMRFTAPVPHATFRMTSETVAVDGAEIPANRQVLVCIAAANRDRSAFPDADRLDLRRSRRSHLSFGHGIHFCLGAPLARLEARVAFTTLLGRFPHMRLAVPRADLAWTHGDGLVLRGLASLPVTLGPSTALAQSPCPAFGTQSRSTA